MAKGFAYLEGILDVLSRRLLAYRLSNSLDTRFCLEALEEALERFGRPDIHNTDQGAQFTSLAFTSALEAQGMRISMDGKGRWRDNIFIERFWWSLKHEEVYLHAYDDLKAARSGIGTYIEYYNHERQHTSLNTPQQAYERGVPGIAAIQPPATALGLQTTAMASW